MKVAAVIIAFSRYELLVQAVASLRGQTRPPDEIIIVEQGGRADVNAWLDRQPDLVVVRQANVGSAGGFATGLAAAVDRGNDWVWTMDDDAAARPDALELLLGCPYAPLDDTGFVVSRIVGEHGRTQQPPLPTPPLDWFDTVLADHCVRVTLASWLGLLVHARAVRRCGLPIRSFFLWNDDLEFTDRVAREFKGYCVMTSVIDHYQKDDAGDPFTPGGFLRAGYAIRNRIGWIKVSRASPVKKAARTARAVVDVCGRVLRRRLPVKSLLWLARGLFLYWPRVEPYTPGKSALRSE